MRVSESDEQDGVSGMYQQESRAASARGSWGGGRTRALPVMWLAAWRTRGGAQGVMVRKCRGFPDTAEAVATLFEQR